MELRRRQQISNALSRLGIATGDRPAVPAGVDIGRHTFGYGSETFHVYRPGARIEVGGFCSIHREARVLAGSEHVMTRASTFPFKARMFAPEEGNLEEAIDKGTTVIGNDVWIGIGAIVLSGVMVGDGAVIGAGAVVGKAVPPYAVIAGNPASILRYRFEADIRRRLLALRWWDWDESELWAAKRWLTSEVTPFLEEMERVHEPRPESDLAQRLRELPPELMTPRRPSAEA
jgi:acetyltransferase-like isoleucine patch superfamily enzyme